LGKGEVSAWTTLIFGGFQQLIESLDGTSVNLGVGVIACVSTGGARGLVVGPSGLMFRLSTYVSMTRELDSPWRSLLS
jgi:hypothetical protein